MDGCFLWFGFGDNLCVVDWIICCVVGDVFVVDSLIGCLLCVEDFNFDGFDFFVVDFDELFLVDVEVWKIEVDFIEEFYDMFGEKVFVVLCVELVLLCYCFVKV